MRKLTLVPPDATANPVYLTAAAMGSLMQILPSGTAYGIGIALRVMRRGRLMHHIRRFGACCPAPGFTIERGLAPR